jgi:thioredoxin-related protein
LPQAVSLADELAAALRHGEPLVVMVSLEGCPFCVVARNSYLAPLRAEGRLDIVQVDMRTGRPLKDFQGQALTHEEMTRRWAIKLAPTVLFFGKGGQEVANGSWAGCCLISTGRILISAWKRARKAVRGMILPTIS